jgi:hypothetical protein
MIAVVINSLPLFMCVLLLYATGVGPSSACATRDSNIGGCAGWVLQIRPRETLGFVDHSFLSKDKAWEQFARGRETSAILSKHAQN